MPDTDPGVAEVLEIYAQARTDREAVREVARAFGISQKQARMLLVHCVVEPWRIPA